MNTSNLFNLDLKDVTKGVVVAFLGAFLTALHNALMVSGLDFMSYQWDAILYVGVMAGVSYLAKNFFSDEDGKVLGAIG